MSRSFKKSPVVSERDSKKFGKNQANRKVRKYSSTIQKGKAYKKVYCSYDICDYRFRQTFEEYVQSAESDLKAWVNGAYKKYHKIDSLLDVDYKDWARYYFWK